MGSMNASGKMAAMYSYSKTKGLFGGVSVEGSVIAARQDANAAAYNSPVSVKSLLSGSVSQPDWAAPLYQTLQDCIMPRGNLTWVDNIPRQPSGYSFEGVQSNPTGRGSLRRDMTSNRSPYAPPTFPPPSWEASESDLHNSSRVPSSSSSSNRLPRQRQSWEDLSRQDSKSATANFGTQFDSDFQDDLSRPDMVHRRNFSTPTSPVDSFAPPPYSELSRLASSSSRGRMNSVQSTSNSVHGNSSSSHQMLTSTDNESDYKRRDRPLLSPREELRSPARENQGVGQAIALFDFKGVEPGDLSFSKGQVIVITEKSASTNTWWKGELEGRKGSFPANFVEVV